MKSAGKVAGLAFAAGVGVAAVATVKFAKAALDAEQSQARLDAAFKHANASAKDRADALKAVNDISNKSGLDDEALADSLAKLTQSSGSATKATKQLAIASDIARGRGIELEAATGIVTKASLGNVGALKRMGIEIPKVTTAQDALKESGKKATAEQVKAAKAADDLATRQGALAALQKKYAGDSEAWGKTAAGALDRFKTAIGNVEEALGGALLPTLAKVAGGIATFLNAFNQAEGAGAKFRVVMDGLKSVASQAWDALRAAFNAINWGAVWDTVSSKVVAGVKSLGTATMNAIRAVDWKAAVADAGRLAGDGIVVALGKLDQFIRNVDWAKVEKALILGLEKAIGAVAMFLIHVDWGAVIGKMISLLVGVIRAEATVLLTIAKVLGGQILKGIVAGMEGIANLVWNKLQNVASKIAGFAKQAYGNALAIGKNIVSGIASGIYNTGEAAVKAAIGWLAGLVPSWARKLLGIGSPSRVMADLVGKPIAQGIGVGITEGTAGVIATITGQAKSLVDASIASVKNLQGQLDAINSQRAAQDRARAVADAAAALAQTKKNSAEYLAAERELARARQDIVIAGLETQLAKEQAVQARREAALQAAQQRFQAIYDAAMSRYQSAVDKVADYVSRSFQAKTDQMVAAVGAKWDKLIAKAQAAGAKLTAQEKALQAFDSQAVPQTDAEKALAALDAAEAERGRQAAITAAQTALANAQQITDAKQKAEAITAAEEQMRVAQLAVTRAGLEERAAAERVARDAALAEQRAALAAAAEASRQARDAETAALVAKLEEDKTKEIGNLTERRNQRLAKLQEQLKDLQTWLGKHPGEYSKINKKVKAIMDAFDVDMKTSGENLGNAFAKGLTASIGAVTKAARAVAQAAANNIKLNSPAKEGPMADLDKWWSALPATLLSGLNTRPVAAALAGAVSMPVTAGYAGAPTAAAGGTTIYNTFSGNYYGPGGMQELARQLQVVEQRATSRNG